MKKRLYSLPVLVVLLVVTVLILRGTYGVMKKQQESAEYVKDLKVKVASLKDRQEELKTDISKIQTDDGLETEIKNRFSVSKAGEHVAVIVDPEAEATNSATSTDNWFKKMIHGLTSLW